VLLVETNIIPQMACGEYLQLLEPRGVGQCSTLEKAYRALDNEPFDCAVINLNLYGESGAPTGSSNRAGHS
jgi:hypothetical protein